MVDKRPARSPQLVIVMAVLLLLPGALFVTVRLITPGDGAPMRMEPPDWHAAGVHVRPLAERGLQDGDIVTGMEGRSLSEWLEDTIRGRADSLIPGRGQEIGYTVLRGGREQQVAVTWGPYPVGRVLASNWASFFFLFYLEAVGLFIFTRRPRYEAAQQLFITSSAILSSGVVFFLVLQPSDLLRPWVLWLWLYCALPLYGISLASLLHFMLIFPEPAPVVIRHRWVPATIYGAVPVIYGLSLLVELPAAGDSFHRLLLALRSTNALTVVYTLGALILAAYTYIVHRGTRERRQYRWLVWSLFIGQGPWLVVSTFPNMMGNGRALAQMITGLLWCAIPTAFAIAILRERLFDIDVIIRRTLIYSSITAILAVLYFGGVAIMQSGFVAITGQESPLAVVASTLSIAALFTPVRRRVQDVVDRRFFRRKYDAEKTVEAFARAARDEVDIDCVREALLEAVCETMQPEQVSLWMRPVPASSRPPEP